MDGERKGHAISCPVDLKKKIFFIKFLSGSFFVLGSTSCMRCVMLFFYFAFLVIDLHGYCLKQGA